MKDTQLALPNNDPETICTTAKISAKDLKDFKLFIKIIGPHFRDFNLVGGVFRAISNRRTCIVETGCRFFSDMDVFTHEIENYLKVISLNSDKKTDTSVTEDDSSIKVKTNEVSMRFCRSNLVKSYIKFISDKKMVETLIKNVDPNILWPNEAIQKIMNDSGTTLEDIVANMEFPRSGPYSLDEFISDKKMVETLLENVDPKILWLNEAIQKIMNDSGTTAEDIVANMEFPRNGPYSLDEFISDKKMVETLLENVDPNILCPNKGIQKIINDCSIAHEDNAINIPFLRNESLSSHNKFISDKEMKETLLENVDPKILWLNGAIQKIKDDSSIAHEDNPINIPFLRNESLSSHNKFISDKEMKETLLENVDRNKLIISEVIPKVNVLRINKKIRILGLEHIYVKHDENDLNKGFLSIVKESGAPHGSQEELKKPFLIPMKKNHYFKLEIFPTLFNKDDIYLKCYLTNDQKKVFVMYNVKVNNLFVNIYSVSELIEESEE